MTRTAIVLFVASIVFFGFSLSREMDVHYTMDYADGGQIVTVPPEALSPFEPTEITYVDEPLIELDSDWNMDVKLFSKFRYTNEFVAKWKAKYGYTPTKPEMSDREFFEAVNLDHPGLEKVKVAVTAGDFTKARDEYLSYQSKRDKEYQLKERVVTKEAGEAAVEEADAIMKDPKFPDCRPGMKFSLWGLMHHIERAYIHTDDIKYAEGWLEMYNHWYETYRPPAQRPKMYIAFLWMPYWRTLGASGPARHLPETERWLSQIDESKLDNEKIFNLYKSVLEHAEYLYICNDVFMPSNWQTAQCEGIMKIGGYFPSFKKSKFWCEHAWEMSQQHMVKETYNDGTHCENSVGYATGVMDEYRTVVRLVRKLGMNIPDEFYRKWKTMYLWAVKIVPPTGNYVPCGDNGIGADGSFTKRAIIRGALEFNDPTMKYFAEKYPEDVIKTANEQFDNTDEVLAAYNKVKSEKPSFTSVLLPDTGWSVMRESWDEKSPYMFFDFGWDEAWHSHPDFGTFNIWAYGRPICTEVGRAGSYEADISKRWYKQTIGHNTVMVDSRSQRKCSVNRLQQWWTGEKFDYTDAWSDGYRWIGVQHNRRVLFAKPDYWIITDFLPGPSYYGTSFQTSGYHEFDWLAHFQPTQLNVNSKTKRIDTLNPDANLAIVPLNHEDVVVNQSKGPVATQAGAVESPYISLHQEGLAFKQYQVLLVPYEGRNAPDIKITPLESDFADRVSRQNVGYEISFSNRKDIFLESGDSSKKVKFGKYEFRGDIALINNVGKSEISYLLLNSDHLMIGGKLMFSAPTTIEALEFHIDKSEIRITSESDLSGVKINAAGVNKVIINGEPKRVSKQGNIITIN